MEEMDIVRFTKADRWFCHVQERKQTEIVRITELKPLKNRPRGKRRGSWEDVVKENVKKLKILNLRDKVCMMNEGEVVA